MAVSVSCLLVEHRCEDLALLPERLDGRRDGRAVVGPAGLRRASGRGCALMMSSTLERAFARSVLSSRLSTISMFLPSIASWMPCRRCFALSAESVPTNTAIFPPLREELHDIGAERLAGLVVVGADVEQSVRRRGVRVERDELGLLGDLVEHRDLIGRRDGAHGDGVVALTREVFEDLVLLLRGAVRTASSRRPEPCSLARISGRPPERSSRTRTRCW